MSTATSAGEQRVILENVSWQTYVALADEAGTPRGRMAFYRGTLEIMSPSKLHENVAKLLGRLVETFTEERRIDVCSVRSTTFRREDLQSGFETDESYYIGDTAAVQSKDELDLTIDPPPDLVIEVDISRSSLRKFGIYGAMGVREVWRFDGQMLRIYVRNKADHYDEAAESFVLPTLTVQDLKCFLDQRSSSGETAIVHAFRHWVRQRFSGPALP